MAKLSAINNNNERLRLIQKKKATRKSLKVEFYNKETTFERRIEIAHKIAEMPRNSSPTRHRNRCVLTGRPRGYHRKFGTSRIALRELASAGLLPGVVKSSW